MSKRKKKTGKSSRVQRDEVRKSGSMSSMRSGFRGVVSGEKKVDDGWGFVKFLFLLAMLMLLFWAFMR
jgi:hypothetical protein